MSFTGAGTRRRPLLSVLTAAAIAVSVSACGSSGRTTNSTTASNTADSSSAATASGSSASTSGLAQAQADLNAHIKAPTTIGATLPIKKPIPKGKHLVYVNCGATACTNQGNGLLAAAKVLGWTVTTIQAAPTPPSVQAAMSQALRMSPDAVVSAGFSRALYPNQMAEMNQRHIAVISSTGLEPTGVAGTTFNAEPPAAASAATSLLADKTVVDMGGRGDIGVVYLTGYPLPKIYTDAYVARVKQVCPACTTTSLNIQPTSIGKDAGTIIANFLRANPNVSHLMLSYDALGVGLPAAVKAAGISLPKVYSYSPDAPGIEALEQGTETAAVPQPYGEIGWMWADALARLWTGGSVTAAQTWPGWVLWSKQYNNLPASANPYPTIIQGYQRQYEKLWGIKS
jgi:ribose transport system substrate-binding protein